MMVAGTGLLSLSGAPPSAVSIGGSPVDTVHRRRWAIDRRLGHGRGDEVDDACAPTSVTPARGVTTSTGGTASVGAAIHGESTASVKPCLRGCVGRGVVPLRSLAPGLLCNDLRTSMVETTRPMPSVEHGAVLGVLSGGAPVCDRLGSDRRVRRCDGFCGRLPSSAGEAGSSTGGSTGGVRCLPGAQQNFSLNWRCNLIYYPEQASAFSSVTWISTR
jgi:hypothetical protein